MTIGEGYRTENGMLIYSERQNMSVDAEKLERARA
jgi:hypothetical protein